MKTFRLLLLLIIALAACENRKNDQAAEASGTEEEKAPVTLQLKWETDPQLTTCESVLYDDNADVLYVSNINGAPDAKDGNGFISKVSLEGEITTLEWVKGMDAPKGMGLLDGKLYVADIDRVHEVDTQNGNISKSHPAEGATFLNDITVKDNKVYVSDSRGGSVYVIEDGKLSLWMDNLQGPNGLFAENGDFLMALWDGKSLNTVDVSSKQVTERTTGIENPDGIEAISNNEYLVSSWNGLVHHIDGDWNKTLILDTRKDSVNSADIEYVKSKNLLLVPTFFKNTVRAYEVNN